MVFVCKICTDDGGRIIPAHSCADSSLSSSANDRVGCLRTALGTMLDSRFRPKRRPFVQCWMYYATLWWRYFFLLSAVDVGTNLWVYQNILYTGWAFRKGRWYNRTVQSPVWWARLSPRNRLLLLWMMKCSALSWGGILWISIRFVGRRNAVKNSTIRPWTRKLAWLISHHYDRNQNIITILLQIGQWTLQRFSQ